MGLFCKNQKLCIKYFMIFIMFRRCVLNENSLLPTFCHFWEIPPAFYLFPALLYDFMALRSHFPTLGEIILTLAMILFHSGDISLSFLAPPSCFEDYKALM